MSLADFLSAVCGLGVAFILGCWWGLWLNVSHMARMRRWADRVVLGSSVLETEAAGGASSPAAVARAEREAVTHGG